MTDKKAKTVLIGFIGIVNESKRKQNKLWVHQGREIYNNLMQKWFDDNDTLIYSTHNGSKLVVAVRFIRTWKGKTYKKMTANDSKSYIGYLNKLVEEYRNSYHSSVGKKSIHAYYSAFSEVLIQTPNFLILKLMMESGLLSTRLFLAKATLKNEKKKYL